MRDALADRIEFLRFLLVAGLVLLHYGPFPGSDLSPFRGWQPGAHPVATFLNAFVLFFFLSAVPLLSAISGWLFFKGFETTPAFYLRRIRARARSILLPMVLWNLIVFVSFVAVAAVIGDHWVLSIVAYDVTAPTPGGIVDALIGVTRHPVNFQFWFLRDLFLTILLSPLLGLMLRVAPLAGTGLLGAVWLSGFDLWIFFRTDVLFFFYLGGVLRVRQVPVGHPAPRIGAALLAIFTLLVAARTLGPHVIPETGTAGTVLYEFGSRLMRAVGVAALWLVAPVIVATPAGRAVARLGAVAFFLHAVHWPLNQFIKHGLAAVLPDTGDAVMLVNYAATAVLTIALAIALAAGLNRLAPGLYDILSGGRAQRAPKARPVQGARDGRAREAG